MTEKLEEKAEDRWKCNWKIIYESEIEKHKELGEEFEKCKICSGYDNKCNLYYPQIWIWRPEFKNESKKI